MLGGALLAGAASAAPRTAASLDEGWQVRLAPGDPAIAAHPREAAWMPAHVPGSVQQDLLALGRIPDPFIGTNEGAVQWVGRADWEYRRTLEIAPDTLRRDHVELVFDGLDTFAAVEINGRAVLRADNAHRQWRIDAKPFLQVGANALVIRFAAPIRALQPRLAQDAQALPGEYDSSFGDEPKGRQTSPYIRKPKYMYGWDWGPRILAVGPWRPVRLEAWDTARLDGLAVEQEAVDAAEARLVVRAAMVAGAAGPAELRIRVTAPDGRRIEATRAITLAPGATRVAVPLTLPHPQLWQPAGYGAHPLYRVTATLVQDGAPSDATERRIGLRTVSLIRDGGALGFRVNGVPIFAKGANLIPFDSFPARVTTADMRPLLDAAVDAHMNMLRVWGGGYYLDDAFYDMADERGLMIWQDFMFGGSVPPPEPSYRASVKAEAEQQVARLGSHASIVLWSGGNEILSGWAGWSDRAAFKRAIGADAQERYATAMADLFDRVLREAVRDGAPGAAYWANSPSDDYQGPVDTDAAGDRHFWDVWSGSKPVEAYLDHCPRFMSEFGFQAAPGLATIRAFAGDGPLSPADPVMKAHQKFLAGEGNDRLLFYMRARLGTPRDLGDFVYLSQVNQAEAIALAARHQRACRPVTMGSLYWQLNDVWPALSWSSIDHAGRWKLLHYAARRFFAPELIVAEHRGTATRIALVSDATTPRPARWRVRGFDMDGRLLGSREGAVTLAPLAVTEAASLDDSALFGAADPKASYAVAELIEGAAPVSRMIVERALPKDMAYPDPGLSARWSGRSVTVTARRLARAVMLDFGALAAQASDNGFDLLPGESRTVTITAQAPAAALARALTLRSLGGRR
ncbi:glycoside hydrolase family 2 protein [Sphingomonas morindae]|uniref:Beta-mannosidase B n=1 Tax=Sphingomonas morindae TaxID=1541170 RepID=A0ABY4XCC5_9SPHN|nr:glycoside hydrolase family 2 protein [Sphingomonas morindae]USI74619.1 glycoside hydrolase family 2 protein [Sphingomonas morindae]